MDTQPHQFDWTIADFSREYGIDKRTALRMVRAGLPARRCERDGGTGGRGVFRMNSTIARAWMTTRRYMQANPERITAREVANKYRVSIESVRRWARRQGAPHRREPRRGGMAIVFDPAEIRLWVARNPQMVNARTYTRKPNPAQAGEKSA